MKRTITVNREQLSKLQKSYKKLKLKNLISNFLIVLLLIILGTQQFILAQPKEQPIIMGTGTMEKVSDNVYEIIDDDKEYLLEEYKLPPMPEIK